METPFPTFINIYKLAPSICTIILTHMIIRRGKISYPQFMDKNAD